jgi:hypothetical protein
VSPIWLIPAGLTLAGILMLVITASVTLDAARASVVSLRSAHTTLADHVARLSDDADRIRAHAAATRQGISDLRR